MKGLLMRLLLTAALLLVSFSTQATPVFEQNIQVQQSLPITHIKEGSVQGIIGPMCTTEAEAREVLALTHGHIPTAEDHVAVQQYIRNPLKGCRVIMYKMVIGKTVEPPNPAGFGIITVWPEEDPSKLLYLVDTVTTDPAGK